MIRPADLPHEGALLAQIHALAFSPGWSAPELTRLASGPGAFALVSDESGLILCRAGGGEAEIITLAVDPARRCQGLGRALVEAAANLARDHGAEAMFLEVAETNLAALALYARTGFETVGRRPGYYSQTGGPPVDAIVMRWHLNSGPASPYS